MLRYSLFAGPFGYGRDKTATRPRVRKHLIIIITKNFLFKSIFYPSYIPFAFPFYLFSFLSFPAALPCRCDFPMRRYSVIRSSSTAPLTGSRICPAAFRKSKMAFQPPPRTSTDWVFREIPRPFACLSVLSPLSGLHVKSLPPRKPKGSESREKKKASSTN